MNSQTGQPSSKLEELERLFGRPVDLITDASIRNPYFGRSVDATKVRLC
jgi:predicted nucleotidyltransferase